MGFLVFLLWTILITNTYQFYIFSIYGKDISLTYILLTIGFLFLLFKEIKEKKYTIFNSVKKDLILRYFLVFLVFLLISVIYSVDIFDGLKICAMVSFGFMSYYLFSSVNINIRKCAWVFVISTLPMVLLMILLSFNEVFKMNVLGHGLMQLFIEPDTLVGLLNRSDVNNILSSYRQGGFFVNTSVAGVYLGLSIVLLFGLYLKEEKIWVRIINQVLIILFISALFTTQSRGAIGAVLISILVATIVILFRDFRLYKRLLSLYIIFILFLSFFVMFNPSTKIFMQKSKVIYTDNTDNTISFRKYILQASLDVIKNNWVLGTGLSAKSWADKYNIEAQKYYVPQSNDRKYYIPKNIPPHNMYLYIWGHSGIFTLSSFLILFYILFFKNVKVLFKRSDYYSNLFVISAIMAILILCLVGLTENFLLADPRISISFWSIIGFMAKMLKDKENNTS